MGMHTVHLPVRLALLLSSLARIPAPSTAQGDVYDIYFDASSIVMRRDSRLDDRILLSGEVYEDIVNGYFGVDGPNNRYRLEVTTNKSTIRGTAVQYRKFCPIDKPCPAKSAQLLDDDKYLLVDNDPGRVRLQHAYFYVDKNELEFSTLPVKDQIEIKVILEDEFLQELRKTPEQYYYHFFYSTRKIYWKKSYTLHLDDRNFGRCILDIRAEVHNDDTISANVGSMRLHTAFLHTRYDDLSKYGEPENQVPRAETYTSVPDNIVLNGKTQLKFNVASTQIPMSMLFYDTAQLDTGSITKMPLVIWTMTPSMEIASAPVTMYDKQTIIGRFQIDNISANVEKKYHLKNQFHVYYKTSIKYSVVDARQDLESAYEVNVEWHNDDSRSINVQMTLAAPSNKSIKRHDNLQPTMWTIESTPNEVVTRTRVAANDVKSLNFRVYCNLT